MTSSPKTVSGALTLICLALTCLPASSAIYYVDSVAGNDAWNGQQQTRSGTTEGPFQSLARLKDITFAPGDQILLKCGHTWREPLSINSSGSSLNPIRVGHYPAGCSNRPVIDGSIELPDHHWVHVGGSIYRARMPINFAENGSFNSGPSGWRAWSSSGSASVAAGLSCLSGSGGCLSFVSGSGPSNAIVSSPAFRLQNRAHSLSFRLNAPAGVPVRITIRRDANPWDSLGVDQTLIGTGAWKSYVIPSKPAGDVTKARVDFEVPPGKNISLDDVRFELPASKPELVTATGEQLVLARHPNPSSTGSPYVLNNQDSASILVGGKPVSTYFTKGPDLVLPTGAALTPGLGVVLRTNAWLIDERVIASVSGNRVNLNSPTTYPLKAGWGYLLTGALWMLDSPGEWHYDSSSGQLYVWMPDSGHPGNRVAMAQLPVGIDFAGASHVQLDGLVVRRTRVGINARNSSYVTVRNVDLADTSHQGIDVASSNQFTLEDSMLSRTGRDAITGIDLASGSAATNMRVVRNRISESGVLYTAGAVKSIPAKSYAAIRTGDGALISENKVLASGYIAIWPEKNAQVLDNYVENICLVSDDCGAIYLRGASNNSTVSGNLVVNVVGAVHGKPSNYTQAQGLYLDDHTTGVTLTDNKVINADHGIQLHNASGNVISGNTLYGNRRYQMWLQADTNTRSIGGDVYGNSVRRNVMVPTGSAPALHQESEFGSTAPFGSYDENRYSALISQTMALETWATGVQDHTLPEWKTAKAGGVPRNLDPNGVQVSLGGNAAFRVIGSNMISNGDLSAGLAGWSSWNPTNINTHTLVPCTTGQCVTYTAGTSQSLLYTSAFSVTKDAWYRVSFDLKTGFNSQAVVVGVRRGGGGSNGFEWLTIAPQTISGTTTWKRYAMTFKATKTINKNDPVTMDVGARLDFQVNAGQQIWLDNVDVVALAPVGASLKTAVVTNPNSTTLAVACPDAATEPAFCGTYVRFSDGAPVAWPYTLGPLGAEIVYSRGDTLIDSDGDGIGDPQDVCPSTAAGLAVNYRGCALNQS